MNALKFNARALLGAAIAAGSGAAGIGNATEPCGDFGECKVLVEINASDGDIGFHWLGDADDLRAMRLDDPGGIKIFESMAHGSLREQKMTETFSESAEPLCWPDPEADAGDLENVVTLREFRALWGPGVYAFSGKGANGEMLAGETELSFALPAAPRNVDFDGSVISWTAGNDLGHCAPLSGGAGQETVAEVSDIVPDPATVPVAAYEVVMEPDVEDGDNQSALTFTVRVPGDRFAVEVPALYLLSLAADTPVKIEVGAIGNDDNATFTEKDGFCVNEVQGCDEND